MVVSLVRENDKLVLIGLHTQFSLELLPLLYFAPYIYNMDEVDNTGWANFRLIFFYLSLIEDKIDSTE